jgi:hypothetical protein
LPAERLLTGGLGTLPLAPISRVAEADLPGVVARMKQRLRGRPKAQAADLWTATHVLMGLRYEEALVDQLLQGVIAMEESVTYQAIIAKGENKGRLQEARKWLVLMGRGRLGEPDVAVTAAIEAISSPERLEELGTHLHEAASWHELLGLPPRRTRRRKPRS